jgi:hypothetical protein
VSSGERVPEWAYELGEGFPSKLSDDELLAKGEEIVTAFRGIYGNRADTWLPELQLALLTVVISEQSRRQLARASLVALIGLLIAGLALSVAAVTLVVQLWPDSG